MKAAIDLICRKLASSPYSHTCSWTQLRANQLKHVGIDVDVLWDKDRGLKKDWSEFDTIYIYHSMDFDPKHPYNLNVFDGPQEHSAKFFERLIWPQHAHIKFISLDYPMPNYGYRCKRKLERAAPGNKSMSDYWRNVDWDAVQAKCDGIKDWVLDPGVGRWKRLVIGDSHAGSVYIPKSLILRKDKRTLRGVLKKGIKTEIDEFGYDFAQLDYLSCYWGNIDIRHHLARENDPIGATKNLVQDYRDALRGTDKHIEIICPLPIEDESRELPSSGLYEGAPFYGSRAERQEILKVFIAECHEAAAKHGWDIYQWPKEWYEMDGVEFMSLMERPRSVHLAWKYYRWNLLEDELNTQGRSASLITF